MLEGQQLRPWHIGDIIADRYEIVEYLGTGGMGVVYRCRELSTGRARAIKTLRSDLEEGTRALVRRFLQAEADALSRVESDFVVRIFDADVAQSTQDPFVVMELLRGRDLEQVLNEGSPLPIDYALTLLWQAACALKAIHAEGIVHRDMKPANLFINQRDDGSTELKVLDFSISRLLDRVTGRTTVIVGTRGYMAPEQAAGYDVDHRVDVFALGQVARAMLSSKDERFVRWHAKATASDRRVRFDSATEAVEALAIALGEPLPNTRVSRPVDTGLGTATTVIAPSETGRRRRAAYGGAFALLAAAAGLWSYVALDAPDERQPSLHTAMPATAAIPSTMPGHPVRPARSEPERVPAAASASAAAAASASGGPPTQPAMSRQKQPIVSPPRGAPASAPTTTLPSDEF